MGRKITFTKGFKDYRRAYGLKAALHYLEGFNGITRGNWGEFEKQARTALKARKSSFTFRPKR